MKYPVPGNTVSPEIPEMLRHQFARRLSSRPWATKRELFCFRQRRRRGQCYQAFKESSEVTNSNRLVGGARNSSFKTRSLKPCQSWVRLLPPCKILARFLNPRT